MDAGALPRGDRASLRLVVGIATPGAPCVRKRRLVRVNLLPLLARVSRFLFKSQLATVWLVLCALGFVVGLQARPDPRTAPYEELFENMSVRSFRESPSDTTARFVVELAARGRVFRQYDVDARRFLPPVRGRDYRRAISGTRYLPLRIRGHVDRGMWVELPDSTRRALLPDEFKELYRVTLDYVWPVSLATNVISTLSGYSIGYRVATWNTSLSSAGVQERVVATPGLGRAIAREAWKRVLLEPVIAVQESDVARFASASATQRIYTNFFRLAVNDSNGFIPAEAARLDSAGGAPEARAMRAFARAVRCAMEDTCDLTSDDFAAVENWALLLDRHGHWAYRSVPAQAAERLRYLGTLAWYRIAPDAGDEPRLWVGPRLLVESGEAQGFVVDEIPSAAAGCPIAWRAWLRGDPTHPSGNAWTAQWLARSRQIAPMVNFAMEVTAALRGEEEPEPEPDRNAAAPAPGPAPRQAAATPAPRESLSARPQSRVARAAVPDSSALDSLWVAMPAMASADSSAIDSSRVDSVKAASNGPRSHPRFIRAGMKGPGP